MCVQSSIAKRAVRHRVRVRYSSSSSSRRSVMARRGHHRTAVAAARFRRVPRALVLGGTGPIGLATARRLLAAGWDVALPGRDAARMPAELAAAGARFVAADRGDAGDLAVALGGGADLLV